MDNLLSYCGLVDTRITASEKYLPVIEIECVDERTFREDLREDLREGLREDLIENLEE